MTTIGLVLKRLFGAYMNAKPTAETIAIYAEALSDIEPEQLDMVVKEAIATHATFVPSVADLRAINRKRFGMTLREIDDTYCPDSLRGIVMGCESVFARRDRERAAKQLTAVEQKQLTA
jgi:hypothetical protein